MGTIASPAPPGERTPAGRPLSPGLASVLSNPGIWRGSDCAPEPEALPTGFAELDAALPGGGWPQGALTEILLAREGIGEIRLALPALSRLAAGGRDLIWIEPPYRPYAPALAMAGLDLGRLLIVRCKDHRDALWAFEQSLRAPECGAAFAWMPLQDERLLRRLQVAAREGRTWGVLWRRPGQLACASPAPLRLGLAPSRDGLEVHVLKRRGSELRQPIIVRYQVTEVGECQVTGNRCQGSEAFPIPPPPHRSGVVSASKVGRVSREPRSTFVNDRNPPSAPNAPARVTRRYGFLSSDL